MSKHKQILDPLSTLCKIALLSFYENGSKISIKENVIEIQKYDTMQFATRKYRGDTKEDISSLYNPIVKAIHWYMHQKPPENKQTARPMYVNNNDDDDDTKSNDNKNDEYEKNIALIKIIIKYTVEGLRKLQNTYEEGNVILSLQLMINNLIFALKDDKKLDFFEEYNESIKFHEDSLLNYDKIKDIWDHDTINNISNLLTVCEKNRSDIKTVDNMLESLNLMLKNTDAKFKKLVTEMNTIL